MVASIVILMIWAYVVSFILLSGAAFIETAEEYEGGPSVHMPGIWSLVLLSGILRSLSLVQYLTIIRRRRRHDVPAD